MFSGKRLRQARIAKGLSREQLGVLINRSYPSIHQYETGGGIPPTEVVEAMAAELAVAIDDLFEVDPHVAQVVDGAPPLTDGQVERLAALLNARTVAAVNGDRSNHEPGVARTPQGTAPRPEVERAA